MPPEFPQFKMLEIEDLPFITQYTSLSKSGLCEYSAANLMLWKDFDRPSYTLIDDSLCLKIDPLDEVPFFLEPLGREISRETVDVCLAHAGRISRASAGFIAGLGKTTYKVRHIRNHFDYLYYTKGVAELKGRRFDGKRNRIRQFTRRHPDYKYVNLERTHASDALRLFDRWRDTGENNNRHDELACGCQRAAIERAFEFYDGLGLMGGALIANEDLAGFAIGSSSGDKMAFVHLGYARPDLPGSFQTLLWEACRNTFSRFECINLEQDLGLAGLRKIKCSYYPTLLEKFEIEI